MKFTELLQALSKKWFVWVLLLGLVELVIFGVYWYLAPPFYEGEDPYFKWYVRVSVFLIPPVWLFWMHSRIQRPYAYFLRLYPWVTGELTDLGAKKARKSFVLFRGWRKKAVSELVAGILNKALFTPYAGNEFLACCEYHEQLYDLASYAKQRAEERKDEKATLKAIRQEARQPAYGQQTTTVQVTDNAWEAMSASTENYNQAPQQQPGNRFNEFMEVWGPLFVVIMVIAAGFSLLERIPGAPWLMYVLMPVLVCLAGAILVWYYRRKHMLKTMLKVGLALGTVAVLAIALFGKRINLPPALTNNEVLAGVMSAGDGFISLWETGGVPTSTPALPIVRVADISDLVPAAAQIAENNERLGLGEIESAVQIVLGHVSLAPIVEQRLITETKDIANWNAILYGTGGNGVRAGYNIVDWWVNSNASAGFPKRFGTKVFDLAVAGKIDQVLAGRYENLANNVLDAAAAEDAMYEALTCWWQVEGSTNFNHEQAMTIVNSDGQGALQTCYTAAMMAQSQYNAAAQQVNYGLAQEGSTLQLPYLNGFVEAMWAALPPDRTVEVKVTPTPNGYEAQGGQEEQQLSEQAANAGLPTPTPTPTPMPVPAMECYDPARALELAGVEFRGQVATPWDIMMFMTEVPADVIGPSCSGGTVIRINIGSVGWYEINPAVPGVAAGNQIRVITEGTTYRLWLLDTNAAPTTVLLEVTPP